MPDDEKPTSPDPAPKDRLTGRQCYNVLSDLIVGVNFRLKDNLIQGLAIAVCVVVGAIGGAALTAAGLLGGAFLGGFIGLFVGLQSFSAHKTITVQLGDCETDLRSYGDVVTCEDGYVTLRVPKSETARVTERLLADLPSIDLTVEDPPIEEVIEQVFAQETV